MIGTLPTTLSVNGEHYGIDSDFRTIILIMQMYTDETLSTINKHMTMLEILFTTYDSVGQGTTVIPPDINAAIEESMWFLNVGQEDTANEAGKSQPRTLDYEKDEQLLFNAVNAVVAKDVREEPYMHWWTFYGMCQSISSDSVISNIINIRSKLARKEKLEDHERAYYNENKKLIDIIKGEDISVDNLVDMLRSGK